MKQNYPRLTGLTPTQLALLLKKSANLEATHSYRTELIHPVIEALRESTEFTKGDLFTLASTLPALKNQGYRDRMSKFIQAKVLSEDLEMLDLQLYTLNFVVESGACISQDLISLIEDRFALISTREFFQAKSEEYNSPSTRMNHFLKFAQVSSQREKLAQNLLFDIAKLDFPLSATNVLLCLKVFP